VSAQPTIQLPWESDPFYRWLSVADFAAKWRRTTRCVRNWCIDGTLVRWGYRVYHDPQGRWWVGERFSGNMGTRDTISR